MYLLPVVASAALAVAALVVYHSRFFVDNAGVVVPGRLVRSSQPRGVEWRKVLDERPGQVISLRAEIEDPADHAEEIRLCGQAGLVLAHHPLVKRTPGVDSIEAVLVAIEGHDRLTWFHCQHGEDRTGIITVAWRVTRQGWPLSKALAEMRRYRCRLKPAELEALIARIAEIQQLESSIARRGGPQP